jgi:transposase
MMTQEEYMNVKALRGAGWSIKQIAGRLGHHSQTISTWLRNGGPPPRREVGAEELVLDVRWRDRVADLLAHNAELQGTSIMRVIEAEGYEGSYPTLARYLRTVRGPTRGVVKVTMRIETTPAEEFQFDWSDCNTLARRSGWDHELHCFGCVLCWSRYKYWYFADSIGQPETFEGLVNFFEAIGGVPAIGRTDRMGQLGHSRGPRFILHHGAAAFAAHHDLAFKACDAGDAPRKGKIERPFRDLKRGFLSEMDLDPPESIAELNNKAVLCSTGTSRPSRTARPRFRRPSASPSSVRASEPSPRCASTPQGGRPARWDVFRSSSGTPSFTPRPPSSPDASSRCASPSASG